jgi:hypothetical protein
LKFNLIHHRRFLTAGLAFVCLLTVGVAAALALPQAYSQSPIREVSAGCRGQNAEVEQATDPSGRYVYEEWIGCGGIGFARSRDGGLHFGRASRLRDSGGGSWDPALSVASNGTVYAAFMVNRGSRSVPVVLASFDHGATFAGRRALVPRPKHNWGDRPFIAAGPGNTVYLTYDYAPSNAKIRLHCYLIGSCAIRAGELNAVMQVSGNAGRTFRALTPISPGYPVSGVDSAPLTVDPNGRIDVLYEGFQVTRPKTLTFGRGHVYFTSSSDGGRTWSQPVGVGVAAGSISHDEWWIDGDIASDAAGTLYAGWDTAGPGGDTGWLSYSTDHGATWSTPLRVVHTARGPNIVEVAAGAPGVVDVAWLSRQRQGYSEYVRQFSISQGWMSASHRVSRRIGNPIIWPGDTFGISALAPNDVMLSWGSAIRGTRGRSEIFATRVRLPTP